VPRALPPYGWPLKPFDRMHPVRGYFNDPRISGKSRSFHFGIDISGADGTAVYSVEPGTVHLEGKQSLSVVAPDGRAFGYWHVVPAVAHHQEVRKHQLLGRIADGWGHVHFAESRGGHYANPLREGALEPWHDATSPRIAGVGFFRGGKEVPPDGVHGAVDVIAEALDVPPVPVPPPWNDLPVTPALLRWRVVQGSRVARPWHTPVDFTKTLLPKERFTAIYAPGTRQNHAGKPGRFRFYLAHTWSTSTLPDGEYRLEVAALDLHGNSALARLPFAIGNEL
jgi:hypothetical protein